MMAATEQPAYNLVYDPYPNSVTYTVSDFQKILEKGSEDDKIEIMKRILVQMLDGNPLPELLMHIIRFVMPSKNKHLKKLLYFYWEIVPKLDQDGNLRQEMILVCNAIQHDLQHPNEYIRGNTLRFLTKLKEPELLEQMVPSVRLCLEYRHAYVRKYAILAVYSIFKVSDHLFPDAVEVINTFLAAETDPICIRNAFIALSDLDRESALEFLSNSTSNLENLDPLLQEAFVEFMRKDATKIPDLKPQYVELLQDILSTSNSNEIIFDCCMAISVLTNVPSTLCSVARKLIDIAIKESDNNVKLIILERIEDINQRNPGSLEELTSDILSVLSTSDIDVRAKALDISLELTSSKNSGDVVKLLKKELQLTFDSGSSDSDSNNKAIIEYRTLLIKNITKIAAKFIEVAADVVSLLLDSMPAFNTTAASDVITFIKKVVEKYPELRSTVLNNLIQSLLNIKSAKAYRGALWVLGEYSCTEQDVQNSWKHIRNSLGPLPLVNNPKEDEREENAKKEEEENATIAASSSGPVILPDGTYATESAITAKRTSKTADLNADLENERPPLRRFVLKGEFYTAAVLASTLVKLVLQFSKCSGNIKILHGMRAEGALMLIHILRVSDYIEANIDEDSKEKLTQAISILVEQESAEDKQVLQMAFLEATLSSFQSQLKTKRGLGKRQKLRSGNVSGVKNIELRKAKTSEFEVDKQIIFRQFSDSIHNTPVDTIEEDLILATKGYKKKAVSTVSKLNKIVQLTGFSDPVYAEACITTHQFDVVLDVLLVNQTRDTLKNLHCQFATLGDLKIIDNPPSSNVVPHGFHKISVACKVTSADTGVIFGNIIYDGGHGEDAKYVIMSDVHIDIMDYIKPGKIDENKFRVMWNEFEWENKINVKSNLPTLQNYLDMLVDGTNMGILTTTSSSSLDDQTDATDENRFLSCNLYSKSSFGEEALANLCLEKLPENGEIVGTVRIRSKGQGLALSLGDRVAAIARKDKKIKLDHI
ncbi:probable Coatomer subunit beta [Saccharomycodes ludwigii]|uniref:Coatomer subunit beta n=1 Tax=Saccharomycodes ludwigii TaxID=36035 RepID=A0A376B4Z5_9ASCO|nr:hypothetical protein SCDLUD_001931 [Saccharomycodes ludwigii]KAH3902118.1 hypothetical protein SCDLUD_001931 [Saccharomycodes ludwigii]SSD59758.1 probable Coatomer subunit beta [Saccharomycodes ludwigii]